MCRYPPHHHPSGPYTSCLNCILASLLLLLCEKPTLATFDLPKCLYCCCCLFVLFFVIFCSGFLLCAVFLAVRVAFATVLLFMVLLLLLLVPVVATVFTVFAAAFAVLLLLRVLSGRQPLKKPIFARIDLPKFCRLCCCVAVVSICAVV